jgi:hypothetical protein
MTLDEMADRSVCQICEGAVSPSLAPCPSCELAAHAGCSNTYLTAGERERIVRRRADARTNSLYLGEWQRVVYVCEHCAEDET